MTREEREQALEWFKNRPITMSGAKKMYDLAIAALEQLEPCEDAVSRTELSHIFAEHCYPVHYDHNSVDIGMTLPGIVEVLNIAPSVTPEQEHGKWEEKAVSDEKIIDEWQSARCSACGKYHTAPYMYYFNNYNFCPNCGARMTEEEA